MALVIKDCIVNDPSEYEDFVISIIGRESGLLSWFLALIKIDPTTHIKLYLNKIEISQGSFSGNTKITLPYKKISTTYFGLSKPWKLALALTILLLPLYGIGLVIGPLYYFFNKQLELLIVSNSGESYSIAFKRSLIENKNFGPDEGNEIFEMIEKLIQSQN
jgi:hypothetical protein